MFTNIPPSLEEFGWWESMRKERPLGGVGALNQMGKFHVKGCETTLKGFKKTTPYSDHLVIHAKVRTIFCLDFER
jgi:hypothetical protein